MYKELKNGMEGKTGGRGRKDRDGHECKSGDCGGRGCRLAADTLRNCDLLSLQQPFTRILTRHHHLLLSWLRANAICAGFTNFRVFGGAQPLVGCPSSVRCKPMINSLN
jgi:hypothetical protein